MAERWTDAEKREIVADYQQYRVTYCPSDDELLETTHLSQLGSTPDAVLFHCRVCGQRCSSADVEKSTG